MKYLTCALAPLAAWHVPAAAPPPGGSLEPAAEIRQAALLGDLPSRLRTMELAGRGSDPVRVLARLDLPRPSLARLRGARDLPRTTEESRSLRQEELQLAAQELTERARTIQAPVRERIEQLGGRTHSSFWAVSGLSAELPAERIGDLAWDPRVLTIELDLPIEPNQNCGSPPPAWSGLGWVPTAILGGNFPNATVYTHGGEGPIRQTEAHQAGYDGSAWVPGYGLEPFRVPLAMADSGFDLETDQWRGGAGCWCPPTTLDVLTGCPTPNLGVHGAFKSRVGGAFCFEVSRVARALDVWSFVHSNPSDINFDGYNTPRAVIWEAGTNFAGYVHGTSVASLAAGNIYMDILGDTSPANCRTWCIDIQGDDLCGQNGMRGAAPEAGLQLLKIGSDFPGSPSTVEILIEAAHQAAAGGAWVMNTSYTGDPDPSSLYAITVDQLAKDFDMVFVASAGNLGNTGATAQVGHGFFNGLIVGATGTTGNFLDAVAPASSHGPLAWPLNNPTTVSARDGVNICAPGGYWTNAGPPLDVMRGAATDQSFTQNASYGQTNGMWVASNLFGSSMASPLVAGAVSALLGERSADAQSDQIQLTSREVRAILLCQAESIASVPLNITNGESPLGYGQGRLDMFASAGFFDQGGILRKGWVRPSKPTKDYSYTFSQGQTVEVALTWDRVVFPAGNPNISNLQLELWSGVPGPPGTGTVNSQLLAQSQHPANNYERVTFTAPSSGTYTVRVTVPSGGFVLGNNPDRPVPFAFAIF